MEFGTLTDKTGDSSYRTASEKVIQYLREAYPGWVRSRAREGLSASPCWPRWYSLVRPRRPQKLLPLDLHVGTGDFTSERIGLGACGDSYYEYLLKDWILSDKTNEVKRVMWVEAMDEMMDKLVYRTIPSNLTYIASIGGFNVSAGLLQSSTPLCRFGFIGMLACKLTGWTACCPCFHRKWSTSCTTWCALPVACWRWASTMAPSRAPRRSATWRWLRA